jgi:hypothetical protein
VQCNKQSRAAASGDSARVFRSPPATCVRSASARVCARVRSLANRVCNSDTGSDCNSDSKSNHSPQKRVSVLRRERAHGCRCRTPARASRAHARRVQLESLERCAAAHTWVGCAVRDAYDEQTQKQQHEQQQKQQQRREQQQRPRQEKRREEKRRGDKPRQQVRQRGRSKCASGEERQREADCTSTVAGTDECSNGSGTDERRASEILLAPRPASPNGER